MNAAEQRREALRAFPTASPGSFRSVSLLMVAQGQRLVGGNSERAECVSRSLDSLSDCAVPRGKAFDYPPVNECAAGKVEGVRLVDPTPVLCLEDACPAVIGDVIVYRDNDHLTATYARTLAPWLGERLSQPSD